jgi:exodeoxyribonuclease VII large subunit
LNVLARGYAAAFDDDGKPVTRAEGLSAGQNLHIRFADRTADAVITGVRESE